jgi:hypothetical protein
VAVPRLRHSRSVVLLDDLCLVARGVATSRVEARAPFAAQSWHDSPSPLQLNANASITQRISTTRGGLGCSLCDHPVHGISTATAG